jgi:hypothetical protein
LLAFSALINIQTLLISVLTEIFELSTLEETRSVRIIQRGRVLSVRWLQISEAAISAGKIGIRQIALLDFETICLQNKLLT